MPTQAITTSRPPAASNPTRNQGFARRQRLLDAAAFDRVFKDSRRSADRYFTVLFRPNERGEARLGFAISRQKVRLAVGRNRLRRLVRESFRKHTDLPAVDIVVLARDAAKSGPNRDILLSLERHWAALRTARATNY